MEVKKMKSSIFEQDIPYKLPKNWKWFYWGDLIASYEQGLIRSNRDLSDDFQYEYLKMDAINSDGSCSLNDLSKTNATDEEVYKYKIAKGDFFINVRNSKELVGKNTYIKEIKGTILYNHMLVRVKHKYNISSSFINAFLNIPSSRKLIDRCKKGTTTVIALYQKDLYKIPIALPDFETYTAIVRLFEDINSKIELNNRINAELEAMAKTIYDYWFVQFDFPGKKGKPYKRNGGKMVRNAELKRDLPEGWNVKSIGEYAEVKKGDLITESTSLPGNIKVVAAGIDFSYTHNSSNRERNTITISGSGANAGFINFWREPIFASDCITVRGRGDTETLLLLHHLRFIQAHILKQAKGSAQPHVYPSDIKVLDYVIPPNEPIQEYGKLIIPINEQIANNIKQNEQLTELRDWLLPMLMNGQAKLRHKGAIK